MKHKIQLILYCLLGSILCFVGSGVYAQTSHTVTGRVINQLSDGLEGVSIALSGTAITTVTGQAGDFSLVVPKKEVTLVFSSVGYQSLEVSYQGQQPFIVTLEADNTALDEVVVVGYGTQRKSDLTGSVASVSGSNVRRLSTPSLDQALQGQAAGLQVSTTSGMPGASANIMVRGIGSVTGGVEPLIVVDGFPGITSLSMINTADIESVEVLKDASATAIYGSRGSNGVIIVTTKQGKVGRGTITVDAFTGIQQVARKLDLMNARQFAELTIESRNNGWLENGGPNASITDPNSVRPTSYRIPEIWQDLNNLPPYDTDWQNEIFRDAPIQDYQLTAQGGNERIRYHLSGGYFNQKGIVINSGFERYSARANIEGELSKRLKVSMNFAPSFSMTDGVPASGHYQNHYNVVNGALAMPPLIPVYNEDGTYATPFHLLTEGMVAVANPVQVANEYVQQRNSMFMQGNAFAEYEFLDGLKLKISGGAILTNGKYNSFNPSTLTNTGAASPATARHEMLQGINWLNENTLSYNRAFGKHDMNAVVGFTAQRAKNTTSGASAVNFADDLIPNISGGQVNDGQYQIREWSMLSYLARLNYSYNKRYFLTATARTDGSSRFGADNRYGTFPSFSVGWLVSEEGFLQGSDFVNVLKLRFSYGLSGNNSIGDYRYIGLLSNTYYIAGGTQVPGVFQGSITNNRLGWETSKQYDLGLDMAFFNNRLHITADYYNRINTDMLLQKELSRVSGFSSAWVNQGKLENKGLELTMGGIPVSTSNFTWSSNFNISFNKNKVIDLGESDVIFADGGRGNTNITRVGSPIGSFYGRVVEGIFMTEDELNNHPSQNAKLGDYRFKNVNGDNIISDDDRDLIGNPQPDFHYGFNNTFTYKSWSLDVLINGMHGTDIFWAGGVTVKGYHGVQNQLVEVYNTRYISPDNPGDGNSPRVVRGGRSNNLVFSDRYIFDGSYLRVRNVTLNYQLPRNLSNALKMNAARIYLNVTNLFTFTDYPGYDPEISHSDDVRATGIDYAGYPPARTTTLGLSLTF